MPSCIWKKKEILTSGISLTYYDPKLDIIVASDASSYGIGACIIHKLPDGTRKSIAHASRSLQPAEKQHSQIEKEALGIIFAVTMFHWYLHGRRMTNPRCRFSVQRMFYRYAPPTDFDVGVLYYKSQILKLSTCLLKTPIMPAVYPDVFRRIPKYSRIQSSQQ